MYICCFYEVWVASLHQRRMYVVYPYKALCITPWFFTGNRCRNSSRNLLQSSFSPHTMISSTWTPTINSTLPLTSLRKTHGSALDCSSPITPLSQFTSRRCHSLPACFRSYWNPKSIAATQALHDRFQIYSMKPGQNILVALTDLEEMAAQLAQQDFCMAPN